MEVGDVFILKKMGFTIGITDVFFKNRYIEYLLKDFNTWHRPPLKHTYRVEYKGTMKFSGKYVPVYVIRDISTQRVYVTMDNIEIESTPLYKSIYAPFIKEDI